MSTQTSIGYKSTQTSIGYRSTQTSPGYTNFNLFLRLRPLKIRKKTLKKITTKALKVHFTIVKDYKVFCIKTQVLDALKQ